VLSIIIVHYNTVIELDQCLHSVLTFIKESEFEVIVLDNNSPDRAVEELPNRYPAVNFIFSKENLGFSKGNNFGASQSYGEYLLFLNPDTILIEDCVTPLINFISANSNAGVCSPMLVYKDLSFQNSTGSKMGILYESAEAFMFINLYRKIRNRINKKYLIAKKPFAVSWTSGAFMVLKKSIFEEAGGFNENYFLNYEDHDLCKRIEDKGYTNYHFPYLKCIHLDQTSQKKDYISFVYNRYLSRIIYGRKHYNIFFRFIVNFIHINGLILRLMLVYFVYNGNERIQRGRGYLKSLKLYFDN